MDVGIIHDYDKKNIFNNQKDFSYFHYDDYWNLKSNTPVPVSSFFDFTDSSFIGSIE